MQNDERIEWPAHVAATQKDLLRVPRPGSARQQAWGSRPNSAKTPGSAKAFRGLNDAKNAEARLQQKFIASGAPEPSDGEVTIIIEYGMCTTTTGSYHSFQPSMTSNATLKKRCVHAAAVAIACALQAASCA